MVSRYEEAGAEWNASAKTGGGVFGVLVLIGLAWANQRGEALLIQFNSCSALSHFSELVLLAD